MGNNKTIATILQLDAALQIDDLDTALRILHSILTNKASMSDLLKAITNGIFRYTEIAVVRRVHPKRMRELAEWVVKHNPQNIYALDTMLMVLADVMQDYTAAYVYVEKIRERCIGQLYFPVCNRAFATCLTLRRYDEAEYWLKHARKTAHTAQLKQIALENQCALLAEQGMFRDAFQLAETQICATENKEKMHHNMAWWGYKAGMLEQATVHATEALSIRRDAQNLLNSAYITYAERRYSECVKLSTEALADVEREFGVSFDATTESNLSVIQSSVLARHYIEEFTKLLVKSCIKLHRTEDARAFLSIGKLLLPEHGYWEDVEDLWPDNPHGFDEIAVEQQIKLRGRYPNIPETAIQCIARAEAFYEFMNVPTLWYSTICREYGVAFEVILKDIVCKGSRSMHLEELIDYISGRPGDPLYGGNKLLHMLRRIRNNVSHEPIADANDAAFSRRILFDEVLAKL